MLEAILQIDSARKRFGTTQALDGVSLEARQGELLGLLGPNGAGKTTLIKAIAGRVRLDSGEIRINGRSIVPGFTDPSLGIVPQDLAIQPLLTARENLQFFGSLHQLAKAELKSRVEEALEWTGLQDRADDVSEKFSGGMKRRLNIACAALHHPKLLLLDEPTVGVDPQSREKIYDMIDALRHAGASVILTTHHLEEAEFRCDHIVIIDHGSVIASGGLQELLRRFAPGAQTAIATLDHDGDLALPGEFSVNGRVVSRPLQNFHADLQQLITAIEGTGRKIESLEIRSASLQSVFIALTGRELRE